MPQEHFENHKSYIEIFQRSVETSNISPMAKEKGMELHGLLQGAFNNLIGFRGFSAHQQVASIAKQLCDIGLAGGEKGRRDKFLENLSSVCERRPDIQQAAKAFLDSAYPTFVKKQTDVISMRVKDISEKFRSTNNVSHSTMAQTQHEKGYNQIGWWLLGMMVLGVAFEAVSHLTQLVEAFAVAAPIAPFVFIGLAVIFTVYCLYKGLTSSGESPVVSASQDLQLVHLILGRCANESKQEGTIKEKLSTILGLKVNINVADSRGEKPIRALTLKEFCVNDSGVFSYKNILKKA